MCLEKFDDSLAIPNSIFIHRSINEVILNYSEHIPNVIFIIKLITNKFEKKHFFKETKHSNQKALFNSKPTNRSAKVAKLSYPKPIKIYHQ